MRAYGLGRLRGERGAVLVIVAVFAIVALLMLAAVVDLGGLRQEKREVTLSTDAAALAGVGLANMRDADLKSAGQHALVPCVDVEVDPWFTTAGLNPSGFANVDAVVKDYLQRNGDSQQVDCQVARAGENQGYVLVSGDDDVQYAFSGVVGQTGGTVNGLSVASRAAGIGGGLRPVGVCENESSLDAGTGSVDVSSIFSQGTVDPDGRDGVRVLGTAIELVLEKEHLKKNPDACNTGDAAGQRGQLNFDGKNGNGGASCSSDPQAPSADQSYTEAFRDGYLGAINSFVERDSGNDFNTATPCLDRLISSNQRVWLPVYDEYDKSRKSYHVTGFLEVEFEGYCLQNTNSYSDEPNDPPCGLDVNGDESEWFRVHVFASLAVTDADFPFTLPTTIDAIPSNAFLCAFESGVTLKDVCTATQFATPGPPPVPDVEVTVCAPTKYTLSSATPSLDKDNKLEDDLTVTVEVPAGHECTLRADLFEGTETISATGPDKSNVLTWKKKATQTYRSVPYKLRIYDGTTLLDDALTVTPA